tara:strand:+ start:59 stop:982 length:924 start_codon:yes stop_codon:yes gene_type:complete
MVLDAFYGEKIGERATLITMMLHARDIVDGWGEYGLFYILVVRFDQCIDSKEHCVSRQKTETMRVILHNIIASCVCLNGHGSWKDLKYILNRLRCVHGEDTASRKPIFKYIVAIACDQLKRDAERLRSLRGPAPTLAGKWVPREKSKKFGWQAKYFAIYCHPKWCGRTLNARNVSPAALKKCLTHYRKTVAFINRGLRTPQINQCSQEWASIDFETNVSRTTLERQEMAFKYVTAHGELRLHDEGNYDDRMRCRKNYISNERHRIRGGKGKGNESVHMTCNHDSMNEVLYHPRYVWVWNDSLISHSF